MRPGRLMRGPPCVALGIERESQICAGFDGRAGGKSRWCRPGQVFQVCPRGLNFGNASRLHRNLIEAGRSIGLCDRPEPKGTFLNRLSGCGKRECDQAADQQSRNKSSDSMDQMSSPACHVVLESTVRARITDPGYCAQRHGKQLNSCRPYLNTSYRLAANLGFTIREYQISIREEHPSSRAH